jgi:hypothetical protein
MFRSAARVVIPLVYVMDLLLPPSVWAAHVRYLIKPVAEMKIQQLPKGPLYWRVENFSTLWAAGGQDAGPFALWLGSFLYHRRKIGAEDARRRLLRRDRTHHERPYGWDANEVFNAGTTDLSALIMFVVDATKPFSSPAKFQ